MKILFLDIETAPSLAYIWHPADQYVPMDRMIQTTWMLTWSAKWEDSDKILNDRVTRDEALAQDDTRIVSSLAALIRKADYIVAHHGDAFDLPTINARVMSLGLEPLGPVQTIDTMKLVKSSFRLPYKKLDFLGEHLGLGRKIKTDFDLWRSAYQGDTKAIKQMSAYNDQDVLLLEKVFHRIKPYVKGLKRLAEPQDRGSCACPYCGSEVLQKRGYYRTQSSTFQRFQCLNCQRYSRKRRPEPETFALHPL